MIHPRHGSSSRIAPYPAVGVAQGPETLKKGMPETSWITFSFSSSRTSKHI